MPSLDPTYVQSMAESIAATRPGGASALPGYRAGDPGVVARLVPSVGTDPSATVDVTAKKFPWWGYAAIALGVLALIKSLRGRD